MQPSPARQLAEDDIFQAASHQPPCGRRMAFGLGPLGGRCTWHLWQWVPLGPGPGRHPSQTVRTPSARLPALPTCVSSPAASPVGVSRFGKMGAQSGPPTPAIGVECGSGRSAGGPLAGHPAACHVLPSDPEVGQHRVGPRLRAPGAAGAHGRRHPLRPPLFRERHGETQAPAAVRQGGQPQRDRGCTHGHRRPSSALPRDAPRTRSGCRGQLQSKLGAPAPAGSQRAGQANQ